jgi:hypothetical protein
MKFTVYYIDDQANPQFIEANTVQMAAWRFVQQLPRSDTSQLTVETPSFDSLRTTRITHFRACDVINAVAPLDEAELELAIRLTHGPESSCVISGSAESLRDLGSRLIRSVDEFPKRPNPLRIKHVFGVPVVPREGIRVYEVAFETDPDVAQYRMRTSGLRGIWSEYGRSLLLLVLVAFACVGIWTLATRILGS